MLRQMKDHLNAVRKSRGWPPPAQERDESGPDVGRDEVVHLYERVRELRRDRGRRAYEAIDWVYGERLIQPAEAKPASGKTHDR